MLKLKLQYFGYLMWRTDSFEKTLMLGKLKVGGEGDDKGWGGGMASLTRWTWVWVNSRSWWWTGRPGVLQSMGSQRVGHDWATELSWVFTSACMLIWEAEWLSGTEPTCQCRRHGFDPWVRKIPWRRKREPTLVFLPGRSHGQRSLVAYSP